MNVNHSTSITAIGRDAWRALAHEVPVVEYDWLRAWEASQDGSRTSVYWWIEDEQGLLAAIAGQVSQAAAPSVALDRHRFGKLTFAVRLIRKVLLPGPKPLLQCGAHCSPGNPVMLRPGLRANDAESMLTYLLDAVESHCRRNKWLALFCGAFENDEAMNQLFSNRGYIRSAEPAGTVLDVAWNSWDDYLQHLKSTHPATQRNIRHQINRGRRSGVNIVILDDLTGYEDEIHRLLSGHFQRKNQMDYRLNPSFATNLKRFMGDRTVIFVAELEGRIIGVTIMLHSGSTMQGQVVGIDPEFVRSKNSVYFNLTFHHPIAWACEAGFDRIVLGPMAYQIKTRRGARLTPLCAWLWQPNRFLALAQRVFASYAVRRQRGFEAPYKNLNQQVNG